MANSTKTTAQPAESFVDTPCAKKLLTVLRYGEISTLARVYSIQTGKMRHTYSSVECYVHEDFYLTDLEL